MFKLQSKQEAEIIDQILLDARNDSEWDELLVHEIERTKPSDPVVMCKGITEKAKSTMRIELLPGGELLDKNWKMVIDETYVLAPVLKRKAIELQSSWRLAHQPLGVSPFF